MKKAFDKRSSNSESLNDVIRQVLKAQNLEAPLKDKEIEDAWEKVGGNAFKKYISKVEAKRGVLYLSLSSSVVRNELMMAKSLIIKNLNKELKDDVVKDVVFL